MNSFDYQIDSHKIKFDNGNEVEFDFPVQSTIVHHEKVIVLLDTVGGICNQNIFAVNNDAQILWQIERSENLDLIGECPFTSISIRENNLSAFNWCGFRFTFDINNGSVLDQYFTK